MELRSKWAALPSDTAWMMLRALLVCGPAVVLVASFGVSGSAAAHPDPIRIGVLLHLSGPESIRAELTLDWAQDNVNAAVASTGGPSNSSMTT
jgi:hypothetical protein